MPWNGHLTMKLSRRRRAKENEPRPVCGIAVGFGGGQTRRADAVTELCHLAFPTKVAPTMRRCGPFGFGGMMEPWRLHFS